MTARPVRVDAALSAAGIPAHRLGSARGSNLSDTERSLYHWILTESARGEPPGRKTLEVEAESLGLDLSGTLAKFAREDLVHTADGEISVAYPFSARPTAHRARFDGAEVYAMCAVDALGIASLLRRPVVVESSDPLTGDRVRVEVPPESQPSWAPTEAVVVAGSADKGAAYRGCCQVLNFFASLKTAQQYLDERPNVQGVIISIPDATEVGRRIFGDVLAVT